MAMVDKVYRLPTGRPEAQADRFGPNVSGHRLPGRLCTRPNEIFEDSHSNNKTKNNNKMSSDEISFSSLSENRR